MTQGSPELTQVNQAVDERNDKKYCQNTKIQRNNLRVGTRVKLSKKNTINKDNITRGSS